MNYSNRFDFSATERANLILSLQHSLKYLHHSFLRAQASSSRDFWLERIRETYAVYHRLDYNLSRDRYFSIVKTVTKERM